MEKKEFKKMFNIIATVRGFTQLSNFYFIESKECILRINLQKSNFGNFYYLNVDIFIQGAFGKKYTVNKDLGKMWPEVQRRPPIKYDIFLDLDAQITSEERKQGLELLFDEYVIPCSKHALSLTGVCFLHDKEGIIVSPALRNQIEQLIKKHRDDEVLSA